ncbi:MAG: 23S rRNA (guanosine(2251)-2'-O)-methyltransferase RlmB [Chloroflexota bacterium]|nr:23S rRNA (guanosine(2251)-2'-O)-methyltransferase RlmB [Chloroflexota bacterium]
MPDYIWGRNPILETLRSARPVKRILLAEGQREAPTPPMATILQEAEQQHIPIETVPRSRLDQLSHGAVHQGCLAIVDARRYATIAEMLAYAARKNEAPFLLILDTIQDINNLGSLLRSAEAAGIHGVIIPEHRAAEITPAVVKTSAGATEYLLIAQETNITRSIDALKKQNIWVIGLAGEARQLYYQADLTGGLALVVGNEGKGISRLVREHCDLLIRLPMHGNINSLNAAVAGSIVLYEALRQRKA